MVILNTIKHNIIPRISLPALLMGCWLCLLATPVSVLANRFEYTQQAQEAYKKATSLRLFEANNTLAQIRSQDPGNLIVYHIEDYIDFFQVYLSDDKALYERLKRKRDLRLDALSHGDRRSPYYLYVQADIRLHWALLRLRFGEYLAAFSEVNKAHKLLQKNQELFPDFMPNLKDLGILHAMVGTIPDNYQWGVKLLSSLKGTISEGKKELEKVLAYSRSNDFLFEEETIALYSFLLLHLDNNKEGAWAAIRTDKLRPQSNPLHCFVIANIAMRAGHNDAAIRVLEQRPRGRTIQAFPYLDYMQGLAKLRRLDGTANLYFQKYLNTYKGNFFIKESYQKLAWCELLQNRPEGYAKFMKNCTERGDAVAGGDKSALREASSGKTPNTVLLKARLLFDGGYYQKALDLLRGRKAEMFSEKRDRLEFTYRMGRILHGLEKEPEALVFYQRTIAEGKNDPSYFACNAALHIGLIYEAQSDKSKARQYYQYCLSLHPDEHETALHQQAKAGLGRIRG